MEEGQDTGKKKSPEETEKLVRQHFSSVNDYVTPAQIRSLFSSFTRKLKAGTLVAPTPKLQDDTSEEDCSEDPSNADCMYEDELVDVVDEVMTDMSLWNPGSWVVIRYRRQWLPGRLVPAEECQEGLDEGLVTSQRGSNLHIIEFPVPKFV